jgi:hypothetical protein
MTPSDALEVLRQVNDKLRSAMVQLRPERRHCSTIKPQDLSDLLGQLQQASECIKRGTRPSELTDALEEQSLEYRSNLENLKHFLPGLQVRMLAEKARLESARNHVAAAAAWAQVRKKTL